LKNKLRKKKKRKNKVRVRGKNARNILSKTEKNRTDEGWDIWGKARDSKGGHP